MSVKEYLELRYLANVEPVGFDLIAQGLAIVAYCFAGSGNIKDYNVIYQNEEKTAEVLADKLGRQWPAQQF